MSYQTCGDIVKPSSFNDRLKRLKVTALISDLNDVTGLIGESSNLLGMPDDDDYSHRTTRGSDTQYTLSEDQISVVESELKKRL